MRICKAYIVFDRNGDEIALLKAKSLADAENKVETYTNERAFNFTIQPTEVNADAETFGWYDSPRRG